MIFCVYLSIQPIQGGIRALIAEACPNQQQQEANAWVSRVTGLASFISYLSAYLDLPRYMSWFGDTQFKNLSVLAVVSLALSVGLTCTYVTEIRWDGYAAAIPQNEQPSLKPYWNRKNTGGLFGAVAAFPRQIWCIFVVQFFAWLGWFPYLQYIST